jgi:hypothetical protein
MRDRFRAVCVLGEARIGSITTSRVFLDSALTLFNLEEKLAFLRFMGRRLRLWDSGSRCVIREVNVILFIFVGLLYFHDLGHLTSCSSTACRMPHT